MQPPKTRVESVFQSTLHTLGNDTSPAESFCVCETFSKPNPAVRHSRPARGGRPVATKLDRHVYHVVQRRRHHRYGGEP